MPTARTARLPFDHLFAELTAFPLASESALVNPLTHLDPAMSTATRALWRAAERELLVAAPAVSLDEIIAMRDGCWFDGSQAARSLQEHLRATTRAHLEWVGGAVAARRPEALGGPVAASPAQAQARQAWMWLTFALPSDLLLAVTSLDGVIPEPELFTPAVRDLLGRGFAETHLHVGAALTFRAVWALLLARLAEPGVTSPELAAPGAGLSEGQQFAAWLIRAAIARIAIAGFLRSGPCTPLLTYLHSPGFRNELIDRAGIGTFSLVLVALGDLVRGTLSDVSTPLLRGAYRDLAGSVWLVGVRTADELDPVGRLLTTGSGSPEQRYVQRACAYLDSGDVSGRPDQLAAQLFWQTVRVRTMVYRHLTQRPLTPGLPWFIRFYGRMAQIRGNVSSAQLVDAASRTSGVAHGLTSLEMRTSPDDAIDAMRGWIRAAACASPDAAAERGLVFHFLKARGGEVAPGVPNVGGTGSNADPGSKVNTGGYRFGGFFGRQRTAAITLARLLHRWPRSQFVVRGIDICADELAVPTWVFCPLVAHVRAAADSGALHLRRLGLPRPPPLRTTAHAGEDFPHLLTGLRHIHEVIDMLGLREGDRIGHGLALGLDADGWARKAGRVAMPVEDRVFDLAWEWTWWTSRGRGADAARLAYVAREIAVLATNWLGMPVEPLDIERLRNDLAKSALLAAVGFPDRVQRRSAQQGAGQPQPSPCCCAGQPQPSRQVLLTQRYLTDQPSFRRGRRIVWIDPTPETDALTRLQVALRAEISRRGLAVEVNPTSNLLIGDLGDLDNHPLWRLSPPRPQANLPPVAITIGSDDPLVFNSTLPSEYQLLFDALVLADLSDSEALEWLDRVRRTGLERRFTTTAIEFESLFDIENTATLDTPALG